MNHQRRREGLVGTGSTQYGVAVIKMSVAVLNREVNTVSIICRVKRKLD